MAVVDLRQAHGFSGTRWKHAFAEIKNGKDMNAKAD